MPAQQHITTSRHAFSDSFDNITGHQGQDTPLRGVSQEAMIPQSVGPWCAACAGACVIELHARQPAVASSPSDNTHHAENFSFWRPLCCCFSLSPASAALPGRR